MYWKFDINEVLGDTISVCIRFGSMDAKKREAISLLMKGMGKVWFFDRDLAFITTSVKHITDKMVLEILGKFGATSIDLICDTETYETTSLTIRKR